MEQHMEIFLECTYTVQKEQIYFISKINDKFLVIIFEFNGNISIFLSFCEQAVNLEVDENKN